MVVSACSFPSAFISAIFLGSLLILCLASEAGRGGATTHGEHPQVTMYHDPLEAKLVGSKVEIGLIFMLNLSELGQR